MKQRNSDGRRDGVQRHHTTTFAKARRPKNPTHETVEIDEKVLEAGSHFGSSFFQHLDFQKAIREGTPPLVTAYDGRMSVQMGLAAQISMTERRWVEMSELA